MLICVLKKVTNIKKKNQFHRGMEEATLVLPLQSGGLGPQIFEPHLLSTSQENCKASQSCSG